MFKRIAGIFFMVAVLGINIVAAQSKDEAAVAAVVERLRKAMIDADEATLKTLTDARLSYGHSTGRVEDKAAFINAIATGLSDFITMNLSNQTIAVAGKTAIVRHTLEATTNDSGTPGAIKLAIMLVWHKDKKAWKLLARQSVRL